jgi:hypothetical protein
MLSLLPKALEVNSHSVRNYWLPPTSRNVINTFCASAWMMRSSFPLDITTKRGMKKPLSCHLLPSFFMGSVDFDKRVLRIIKVALLQLVKIDQLQHRRLENIMNNESVEWVYDPVKLLDHLVARLNLTSDAALSRVLGVSPAVISKIRHRRVPVGASMLVRMNNVTDLSIKDLRLLMGDRRDKFLPLSNEVL